MRDFKKTPPYYRKKNCQITLQIYDYAGNFPNAQKYIPGSHRKLSYYTIIIDITLIEIDRTENIISSDMVIDKYIFIRIYGNVYKDKINLALIFKNQRLYGFDSEGGGYHCHFIENPDNHIFVDEIKSLKDFVQESMRYMEEREIL